MDYIVRKKFIIIKPDDTEEVLCKEDTKCENMIRAVKTLNEMRDADRAMYRLAVSKVSADIVCDDWHSDTAYVFRVGQIVIETEIVDALQYACKMFALEDKPNE